MNSKEMYRYWMNQYGLTDSGRMAIGYIETKVGITIILRNGTGIPYPYLYDKGYCCNLLN